MNKSELRNYLINKRKTLKDVSDLLVNDLLESNILDNKKIIGLYYPLDFEINVLRIMDIKGISFCFPKVEGNVINFYMINSLNDFKKGNFNVFEPTTNILVNRDSVDMFIIPCVGITYENKRIGYGKGYYDRYLNGYKGLKVSLNYKECCDLDFKANDYDVVIDYVFKR